MFWRRGVGDIQGKCDLQREVEGWKRDGFFVFAEKVLSFKSLSKL